MNFPQNELTVQIFTPESLGIVKTHEVPNKPRCDPKIKLEFS
jgi:hypothetical protein